MFHDMDECACGETSSDRTTPSNEGDGNKLTGGSSASGSQNLDDGMGNFLPPDDDPTAAKGEYPGESSKRVGLDLPEVNEDDLKRAEEKMTDEEKLTFLPIPDVLYFMQAARARSLNLKRKGNELYVQKEYKSAAVEYTNALLAMPPSFQKERAILYGNRAAATLRLDFDQAALEDCNKAIELDESYVKVLLRRAELREKLDKLDEALNDYKKVLEIDPGHHGARAACMRLPPKIEERNERLKAEMLCKLKELGNLCLKPFGLSTDNFKVQQDPSSGSYSINFQQNAQK